MAEVLVFIVGFCVGGLAGLFLLLHLIDNVNDVANGSEEDDDD